MLKANGKGSEVAESKRGQILMREAPVKAGENFAATGEENGLWRAAGRRRDSG